MRDPLEAAAIGVHKRRARAAVKKAIMDGLCDPLTVARVAWDEPESTEASLRVPEFLMSIRGLGSLKVSRLLHELGISDKKHLGALGNRQRESLGEWLRGRKTTSGSSIPRGRLIVIAGPTAVGKGTVVARIRETHPEVRFSVSATTRSPRPGEVHGVHYFFVSDEEFDRLVEDDEMLEWALVHGLYRYGTPREPILSALSRGEHIILEIDIQGARQVKRTLPEAVLVFLLPPTWEELVRRLTTRATESPEEQERRLVTAREEFDAQHEFDVTVVNENVIDAAEAVVDLMTDI